MNIHYDLGNFISFTKCPQSSQIQHYVFQQSHQHPINDDYAEDYPSEKDMLETQASTNTTKFQSKQLEKHQIIPSFISELPSSHYKKMQTESVIDQCHKESLKHRMRQITYFQLDLRSLKLQKQNRLSEHMDNKQTIKNMLYKFIDCLEEIKEEMITPSFCEKLKSNLSIYKEIKAKVRKQSNKNTSPNEHKCINSKNSSKSAKKMHIY